MPPAPASPDRHASWPSASASWRAKTLDERDELESRRSARRQTLMKFADAAYPLHGLAHPQAAVELLRPAQTLWATSFQIFLPWPRPRSVCLVSAWDLARRAASDWIDDPTAGAASQRSTGSSKAVLSVLKASRARHTGSYRRHWTTPRSSLLLLALACPDFLGSFAPATRRVHRPERPVTFLT